MKNDPGWELLRAIIFENWLRFYFIPPEADEENLKIMIPEKTMNKIQELYPDLYPLAKSLNDKHVDFDTSRTAILAYVANYLDGKKMAAGLPETIFASSSFQISLQLFHAWTQLHEEQLDMGFLEFGKWLELYKKWKDSAAGKNLAHKLESQLV